MHPLKCVSRKILELIGAESASKDSNTKVHLQKRQGAEDAISPESQGDATGNDMDNEPTAGMVGDLLEELTRQPNLK